MIKRLRFIQTLITLLYFGLIFGLFGVPVAGQHGPEQINKGIVLLENFQEDSVGQFPLGWYDRNGNKTLQDHDPKVVENYNYRIKEEESNKFLRYEGTSAKHINYPLINKKKENIYGIDIYETPILSWKVRAFSLPNNGNEEYSDRNDVVASVYVVFDFGRVALFKKVPKSIRYTWSTTLEEGTETSKLFGNQQIVVVESGSENTGKWITFERNIVEDYRRLFGDDPPRTPLAILILSDGDSTGSYVKADYDDIMLKSP